MAALWQPIRFKKHIQAIDTSSGPSEIDTDGGRGYIKALGNKLGPQALACDWIGTLLAKEIGLPTFEMAKMRVTHDDEIPLGHGRRASPGMAIVFRSEDGEPWNGTSEVLSMAENVECLSGLVLLDTWIRNCDRHPPDLTTRKRNVDNVFLSTERAKDAEKRIVLAIDHTHIFDCGRELLPKIANIDYVKDDRIYGLFPEYIMHLADADLRGYADRIDGVPVERLNDIVRSVDSDWEVSAPTLDALVSFLTDRRAFVRQEMLERIIAATNEPTDEEEP